MPASMASWGCSTGRLAADDTWSRRALAGRAANIEALRSPDLYRNRDRYKRAVMDINRVLHMAGLESDAALSLSNYGSPALSPVRSADLIRAAEEFESNPFHSIFSDKAVGSFRPTGTGDRRRVDQFHEPGPVCLCHDRFYPQAVVPGERSSAAAGW